MLKRPLTPTAPGMVDYQSPEHEQLMKRLRPPQSVEEVPNFLGSLFGCARFPAVNYPFILSVHLFLNLLLGYLSNSSAPSFLVSGRPSPDSSFHHSSRLSCE